MRLSYYEESYGKKLFLSSYVKLLLLRKDEESSEWYATCSCVCACVCGWRKEKRTRTRKGGVVERKEGDRFVLFFFLPTSIYDNEREEEDEDEDEGKKPREKERGCFFFFFFFFFYFSSSARAAERARARSHTRTKRSRKMRDTRIHILNGVESSAIVSIR